MAAEDPGDTQGARARVFIVDDHPIVRQGLAQLINQEADLEVCGTAATALQALESIARLKPSLVVTDLSLGETTGTQLVADIKVRYPDLPILVLSMHDEELYAERTLRAGAMGYIMKNEGTDKLVLAIRQVLSGRLYVSDAMAARMVQGFVSGRPGMTGTSVERLSDRELQVFELLGRGMTTRQIAETLHVSVKTVESHRAHIKDKLKLSTATELLRHAMHWVQDAGKS